MLTIYTWYGRLGNNIVQIINAIYFAQKNNHKYVNFPLHNMFKQNSIEIDIGDNIENTNNFSNRFFYINELKIYDLEPHIMKTIFQKYIKPIMNIEFVNNYDKDDTIYFHFRGGDNFTRNGGHPKYVQPPLIYYKDIIKNYKKAVLICEDKRNPCINELLKLDNVEYQQNNVMYRFSFIEPEYFTTYQYVGEKKDIYTFSNASNIGLCSGTFSLLAYLVSDNLKNLYITDIFHKYLSNIGIISNNNCNWGDNLNVHIINLPNYIEFGKWNFNDETKKLLLEYNYQ